METSIKARAPSGRNIAIGATVGALILLALGIFLSTANRRKTVSTRVEAAVPAAERAVPPIDAVAPTAVETATFALG